MKRNLSNLGPALFMALLILVASALTKVTPHVPWAVLAGPVLLALGLIGIDLVRRRRWLPSPSALLVAAAILGACGILASGDRQYLAAMVPILGTCAAVPVIRRRERLEC